MVALVVQPLPELRDDEASAPPYEIEMSFRTSPLVFEFDPSTLTLLTPPPNRKLTRQFRPGRVLRQSVHRVEKRGVLGICPPSDAILLDEGGMWSEAGTERDL
jgi:hypothetical protein